MRKILCSILLSVSPLVFGQGTFIYDQQSSTNAANGEFGYAYYPNLSNSIGQSFTPSLPSINFVGFGFFDSYSASDSGSIAYVNLRSTSYNSGSILSSTVPVFIPAGIHGDVNFFFPNTVSLIPQGTYFFELIVQSGDPVSIFYDGVLQYQYSGGQAYGIRQSPVADLWFREGIIVPEPSTIWLALLGGGAFFYARKRKRDLR